MSKATMLMDCTRMRSAERRPLLICRTSEGKGTGDHDTVRVVTWVYEDDGSLLAHHDPQNDVLEMRARIVELEGRLAEATRRVDAAIREQQDADGHRRKACEQRDKALAELRAVEVARDAARDEAKRFEEERDSALEIAGMPDAERKPAMDALGNPGVQPSEPVAEFATVGEFIAQGVALSNRARTSREDDLGALHAWIVSRLGASSLSTRVSVLEDLLRAIRLRLTSIDCVGPIPLTDKGYLEAIVTAIDGVFPAAAPICIGCKTPGALVEGSYCMTCVQAGESPL